MSDEEYRIPESGDFLSPQDVNMIFQAIKERHEKFPDEPMQLTAVLVMLNVGDRFAPVSCVEECWEGYLKDVPSGEGVPKCPEGHPLFKEPGLRLAWVKDIS